LPRTKIEKPTPERLRQLNVESWNPWSSDPDEFDWQYPSDETAYVKKGRVVVTEEGGEQVEIKAGDLVTFPKGLKCRWKVLERIEKVYAGG
jgi:uncharacterized cupin superfamily protein